MGDSGDISESARSVKGRESERSGDISESARFVKERSGFRSCLLTFRGVLGREVPGT